VQVHRLGRIPALYPVLHLAPRQDASQPLDVGWRRHWPADDDNAGDLAVLVEAPERAEMRHPDERRVFVTIQPFALPASDGSICPEPALHDAASEGVGWLVFRHSKFIISSIIPPR
jgi:hypothetical protein